MRRSTFSRRVIGAAVATAGVLALTAPADAALIAPGRPVRGHRTVAGLQLDAGVTQITPAVRDTESRGEFTDVGSLSWLRTNHESPLHDDAVDAGHLGLTEWGTIVDGARETRETPSDLIADAEVLSGPAALTALAASMAAARRKR